MGNIEDKRKHESQNLHPIFREAQFLAPDKLILSPKGSNQFYQWVRKSQEFIQYCPPTCLLLPQYEQIINENYCGTEKAYKLIYPQFKFSLKEEIKSRKSEEDYFTEIQLWYLLYRLLEASYVFQKRKTKSGDIRPANILLNEKGQIALINTFSFPNQKTNYYKSLLMEKKTFLAPQQLGELQMKIKFPKNDPATAQSFSIGVTMLDAALLEDSEELYDIKNMRFKNRAFSDNVVRLKTERYSPFFAKTIINLLQSKCVERLTPGQALAIVRPYENEITNLQEFSPDREKSRQSLRAFQERKISEKSQ